MPKTWRCALLLALLGLFLLASPVRGQTQAKRDTLLTVLVMANVSLAGADLGSTIETLRTCTNGCYEANPLLKPFADKPWALGAVKMGGTSAMMVWAARAHEKHPKLVKWVLVGTAIAQGVVIYSNVKHAR